MKKKLRLQFLVNPPIQLKLIFLVTTSIMIPTLLTFMSIFYLINSILMEAQVNDEVVYAALMFLGRKVYLVLAAGFIFISFLLLTWSMIFIHRIVGPLYRLEREIARGIVEKKLVKIRFRKNDSFKSLADKINLLIERVRFD